MGGRNWPTVCKHSLSTSMCQFLAFFLLLYRMFSSARSIHSYHTRVAQCYFPYSTGSLFEDLAYLLTHRSRDRHSCWGRFSRCCRTSLTRSCSPLSLARRIFTRPLSSGFLGDPRSQVHGELPTPRIYAYAQGACIFLPSRVHELKSVAEAFSC